MRFRTPVRIFPVILSFFTLFPSAIEGQVYRFSNWQTAEGLPGSNVVYSLAQDANRFLWAGTTDGVARFDGIEFLRVSYPDSTVSGNPVTIFKDSSSKLWFGFSTGAVCAAGNNRLSVVFPDDSSTVSEIVQSPDGFIYVFFQQKSIVLKINPLSESIAGRLYKGNDDVTSAAFTAKGDLLIGSTGKIFLCRTEDSRIVTNATFGLFDYARVMAIQATADPGRFIVGTEGNGLFLLDIGSSQARASRLQGYPELESVSVKDIYSDADGTLWISTLNDGVVKLRLEADASAVREVKIFNTASGLAGDRINAVVRDNENNLWIGHNGRGLSMLATEAFSFHAPESSAAKNIIFIAGQTDGYLLGTPGGYSVFDPHTGKAGSFVSLRGTTGNSEISCYAIDSRGNLLIGTRGGGLYIKRKGGAVSLFYRSGESGRDNINDIAADIDNIWLASVNGVSIIDASSGILKEYYNMNNRLPFNNTSKVSLTPSGSAWVATQSITFDRIDPGKGVVSSAVTMGGSRRNRLLSVCADTMGYVWAGTEGYGLFGMTGDSVISVTAADGLLSDKINGIYADSKGLLWIGHDRGLSIVDRGSGNIRSISTDFDRTWQCNPGAMCETAEGNIMIGTTEGFIIYDRKKDVTLNSAPVTSIVSVTIGDRTYPYEPSFRLPYRKRYQVTVKYDGIKLSDPGHVFYSTYMENYDDGWSEFSGERQKSYSLSSGKYTFSVISSGQDGLRQDKPVSFAVTIRPPVWRQWWFIIGIIAGIVASVIHLIRVRERAARIRQKELEQKVDERTREVETQKKEIERQNIEITDSINYARRIQSSVLPDVARLREVFTDAFILFHPRDIVSGDFYWFDKADDGTVVVVCADSTGHGVPGAFMSMIGASFLQDIVKRQKETTPSRILGHLDRQIFSMLNQNSGNEVANDGMDLVVCEYNPERRHVRFASAMRPVILVMDGELFYIKGNKHSVGGESTTAKFFDDQEYYLKPGDMIYLFTDGIADQFGGPYGKKMLIPKLRSFIEDNYKLPLAEQKTELSKFFYEWKKDEDQVDDVLFMGLRV